MRGLEWHGGQTLCWGSYFLFHCLAAPPAGYLVKFLGSRILFASVTITCVIVLYPALRGWLNDSVPPPKPGTHLNIYGFMVFDTNLW